MGQWVQDKKVRSCERITTKVCVSRTRDPQLIRYIYRAIGAEWQPKQGGICGAVSLRGRACLLTLAMLAHHHWRLRRTIIILRVCEFSLAVEFLQQLYWQFSTAKLLSQSESTRVLAILSHVERSSALTQPLYTTK